MSRESTTCMWLGHALAGRRTLAAWETILFMVSNLLDKGNTTAGREHVIYGFVTINVEMNASAAAAASCNYLCLHAELHAVPRRSSE